MKPAAKITIPTSSWYTIIAITAIFDTNSQAFFCAYHSVYTLFWGRDRISLWESHSSHRFAVA